MAPVLGGRARLVAGAVGLTLLVLVPGSLYLRRELGAAMAERIEGDLEVMAIASQVAVAHGGAGALSEMTDALGARTGRRVTIVGVDGRVVADSELSTTELAALPDHGDRPEVIAARVHGRGVARRHSDTLDADLLYVAVADDRGVVTRVSQSLAEVDAALAHLRNVLILAGLGTLSVGLLLAALASQGMARSLRALTRSARRLAADEASPPAAADAVGGAAGELERAIAALASERARLKAILESLSDGVVALDPEHAITLINPAARAVLGAGDDAVGRSLLELVRAPALQDLLEQRGDTRSAEFDVPGSPRRVHATVTPPRAGHGRVLVFHDVTEVRRLETIRRDFVANVSHELRTPVSVLRANAETLLGGALDDGAFARPLVDAMGRNAERLGHIIEDLLDLSRLEAGRYELDATRVAAGDAVHRAIEAVAPKASARGVALTAAVDDRAAAWADPDVLHQVLVNLLDNAIKYGSPGGRVQVATAVADDRLRLEVRDDGPGIAPAHRERVFERFYRIDPGRSRDMGGTGLGLAIVKHLTEAMAGRVGVAPNHPRGTIVWLELPRPVPPSTAAAG